MDTNFVATPAAIKAGMMIERRGETCITPVGLFAMAGQMAYDPKCDKEASLHCMEGIHRVLRVAQVSGLPEQTAQLVLATFAHRINPSDGSEPGNGLAAVCRDIVRAVGADRIFDLIEGRKSH